jgi:hypothetical protein
MSWIGDPLAVCLIDGLMSFADENTAGNAIPLHASTGTWYCRLLVPYDCIACTTGASSTGDFAFLVDRSCVASGATCS